MRTENASPTTVRVFALIRARLQATADGRQTLRHAGPQPSVEHVAPTYHLPLPVPDFTRPSGESRDRARTIGAPAATSQHRSISGGSRVKTFPTAKIRNVALVGHGGAGKTTLAEALLFASGTIPRMGRVEDGNTVCDFDPEEARRRISVSLALAPFEIDGHKVNLVDTPGYADFVGDVAAALRAVDLVVCVVSAVEGVEVQTEVAWHLAEERGIPRVVFVNKLDRERASFERTLDQLKERFGTGIAPLELPIGEEAELPRRRRSAHRHRDDLRRLVARRARPGPVPDEMAAEEHSVHDALIEGIVVADDDLTERYLADEEIETKELEHALATGIDEATVFPVLCGSATRLIGVDRLARFIVEEGPAPHVDQVDGDPAAFVFKTLVDPYVGRVNLFKVLQGTVKTDATLLNGRTVSDERMHQVTTMRGKEQEPASEVPAGDIAAVAKLERHHDRRRARDPGRPDRGRAVRAAEPGAVHRDPPEVEGRRGQARERAAPAGGRGPGPAPRAQPRDAPDAAVGHGRDPPVDRDRAARPQVRRRGRDRRREGPLPRDDQRHRRGRGEAEEADRRPRAVRDRVAPGRADRARAGFEFVDAIVGGVIPRNFIPAVEKGVHETIEHGGALGYPVVDVKVTCFDGKHHPVDSSEMAFKTAASLGFKEALAKAGPVLLEPISELVVTVPESHQGDIMGDLNSKRRSHPGQRGHRPRRGGDRRDGAHRRRCSATRSTCAR